MIGENFDSESVRKATVAFGALFNTITLMKKDGDGNELKRIKVPLSYGSKEKYLARISEDATNQKPTQLALPRMAFSLVGMSYDPQRKQQTMLKNRSPINSNPNKLNTQFVPVPYDLYFELQIMTREISDGLQIIGQILPWFTPDYTVNIVYNSTIGELANKDTPIILNNTSFDDTTEGASGEVRLVVWTLNFTMKAWVFGPDRTQSQIKRVQIDFYIDGLTPIPELVEGQPVFVNTTRGSNVFVTSSNVAGIVNANSIVTFAGNTVKINNSNNTILTGNVRFTTDAQTMPLYFNAPSTVIVSRYSAQVTPNTATISDQYVLDEMFEDYP